MVLNRNLWNATSWWDAVSRDFWDSRYVRVSWNQTIWGTKTFSSPVVGQTPTAANHLATRAYVDANVGSNYTWGSGINISGSDVISVDNTVLRTTGSQTKSGNLWFNWGTRYIGTTSNNHFILRTNGSNRLTIRNNGRVGIGTTSPDRAFHVSGATRLAWNTRIDGTIRLNSNVGIARHPDTNNSLRVNGNTRIDGNTHLNGNARIGGTLNMTNNRVRNLWNTTSWWDAVSRDFWDSRYVQTSRTITAWNGLSWGWNLWSNRTLSVDNTVLRTTGSQTKSGNLWFNWGTRRIGTNDNNHFILRSNNVDRMIIRNNGNVGIWTNNPTQRLDVDGQIRMRQQTQSGDHATTVATKGYVDSIAGGGIISTIRAISGNILPPAPSGLSEWPSFLLCDNSESGHILIPFQSVRVSDQSVIYTTFWSISYIFNSDGSYPFIPGRPANCGHGSAGPDIVSICNAGYCVFD